MIHRNASPPSRCFAPWRFGPRTPASMRRQCAARPDSAVRR
ncbi:hypothetical protein BURPSPAST_A0982 [Burkholderia pseudomallei Pasteur 52237]|nr:hypothetical protein BURPSPAST_A0982 [Burkholderia pseudomallei Pasteur 52237]